MLFMMYFGTNNWRLLRLLGRTELKKAKKINVKDQKGIFWLKTSLCNLQYKLKRRNSAVSRLKKDILLLISNLSEGQRRICTN